METSHDIYGAPELHPGNSNRPKVTFALFAYNQERYIRAAVEGALSQKYEALEIILSDDASSDNTFSIMQEVLHTYSGPHRVRLNRNVSNMGLAAHVNHVLAMAEGEVIVFAAGDDISLPERVNDTIDVFTRHREAVAVSFTDCRIDSSGNSVGEITKSHEEVEINLDLFLKAGPRAQSRLGISGASRAIRRSVYDCFGSLMVDCPAEDSPYLQRSLYLGSLIVCGWPAIEYRVHSQQMSSERSVAGMNPELFRSQYIADLGVAVKLSPQIRGQKGRILHSFYERETAFLLRRLVFSGGIPSIDILYRVITSSQYSAREKLGLFMRFITRRRIQ